VTDEVFRSGTIEITRSIARFGETSYPIANIGAVSVKDDPSHWVGVSGLLVIAGIIGFFGGSPLWGIVLLSGAIVAGIIASTRGRLKVMLRTSSGNEQAFTSTNKELVRQVKAAIESAVASRG
jgi:hypothetical protein